MAGNDRSPVTVIGLGTMGRALAGAFLNAGHPTTVWNRSPGKADDLVAKGARRAATVAEAVSASPVAVVCVSDYDAVHETLDPLGDALAGRVVVNLTSGIPEQAREMAGWAAQRGADYLDGAIMAIPQGIGQPETTLLYSGSSAAFEAYQALLKLLGGGTTYLGPDAGLAPLHDVALLSLMYTTLSGFFHALALVGTERIAASTFMPLVTYLLTAVSSWLPEMAREVDERRYETDVSSLDVNKAGIAHIIHASQDLGIPADVLRPMQALIDRRVAEGHGTDGLASLIEVLRRPAVAARPAGS
jgi:3-hydroxyisobutyrate dehydrogenase-like beta-hydroxyacid dehydrogenase